MYGYGIGMWRIKKKQITVKHSRKSGRFVRRDNQRKRKMAAVNVKKACQSRPR